MALNRLGDDVLPILIPGAEGKFIPTMGIVVTERAQKLGLERACQHKVDVHIQDGCTNGCEYCCMHYANRPPKSLPYDQTINHIKDIKEKLNPLVLNIEGENIGLYGVDTDGCQRLPDLIRDTDKMGFTRGSLYNLAPQQFTLAIVEAIRETNLYDEIRLNIDVPSERMEGYIGGRTGQRQKIAEGLKRIREVHPQFVCRTAIVVGLPGETMDDLDDAMKFCKENDIIVDRISIYRGHESLPIAKLPDQIDEDEKKRRVEYMMQKAMAQMGEQIKRMIKLVEVEFTVGRIHFNEIEQNTYYEFISPWGLMVTSFYDESCEKLKVGDKLWCTPFTMEPPHRLKDGSPIIDATIHASPSEVNESEESASDYFRRMEETLNRGKES